MATASADDLAVAVLGVRGRMGQAVAALLTTTPGLRLSAGWCRALAAGDAPTSPVNAPITADLNEALDGADVAVDFTLPGATAGIAAACAASGCALVSGTTGLDAAGEAALADAARHVAVLHATNMSTGAHVLMHLAARAAAVLEAAEWDIDILDVHHRHKRDAPSGTALSLGEAVAGARGQTLDAVRRDGAGRADRQGGIGQGGIGFAAQRGGDVVGEHTVAFRSPYETLELSHRAASRRVFAAGALRAARWLAGRDAGRYRMQDVLGLS